MNILKNLGIDIIKRGTKSALMAVGVSVILSILNSVVEKGDE